MYIARIQDFQGEEPIVMPQKAQTCLQAVTETLEKSKGPLSPDELIEGLFRRGYAILPVNSCQANQIFTGNQA